MDEENLSDETIEIFQAQLDKIYQSIESLSSIVSDLSGEVELIRKILEKALL